MQNDSKNTGSGGNTRRDFIRSTAVGAAGALMGSYALSSKASGQEEAAPEEKKVSKSPNERVNLGLIGTGGMGSGHLIGFMDLAEQGLENVNISAVCDVAVPRLESNHAAVEKRQGNKVHAFKDYRALLDCKDVDCVLIASPEHWHAQMAIDALSAGKDVYVEKPMTLRLDDALRLYRKSMRSKNFVCVGTQYMTWPQYRAARKLIAEGGIGHPTFSQTSYCRNSLDGEWLYGIDPAIVPGPALDWDAWCGPLGAAAWNPEIYFRWRRYRKYSTGIMGDLLVHMMTPLMMAVDAGWPTRVTATGGHYVDKAMENHDQLNLTVQFEKGHTMIVAGSTCNQIGLEPMIRGHEGTIYLGSSDLVMRPEAAFVEEEDKEGVHEKFAGVNTHPAIRRDFLECVRTRKPTLSPVEHATKVMVIVDLATRSMWEGSAFSFDPVNWVARAL